MALEPDGLSPGEYDTLVKFGVAKRRLADRDGPGIGFEPPPWLAERSGRLTAHLAETGAALVGDLTDLEPRRVAGIDPDTVEVDPAEVAGLRAEVLERVRGRRE